MRKTLSIILLPILFLIFSCSKDNQDPPTPVSTSGVVVDTLGIGWQKIKVDTTVNFEDIFFVNAQTGFLCGEKYLAKTTDGGVTWKTVIPDSLKQSFTNLFFVDANNGWVTGQNFLLRTRDGGASWQKAYIGTTFDVQFFDANNGYVTIDVRGLFKTSDGGITLQQVASNNFSYGLFFLDINKGWFFGHELYKTENTGLSFTKLANTVNTGNYAMQFTDALHGWIGGATNFYRTVDGGVTLETILSTSIQGGGDVQFFDNNNGFVMLQNKIYSTVDGGKTLTPQCSIHLNNVRLIEFHFTDINHGWATGVGGYVFKYAR